MKPAITLSLSFLLAFAANTLNAASIPSNMPETRAIDSDLARIERECQALQNRLSQLRHQVKTARDGVSHAIDATKAIKATDERLITLIDNLQPYTSVPKVRTIARTLRKNLQRIQDQIHALRKKTDKAEKEVLRPAKDRLRELEQSILGGEAKLAGYRKTVSTWRRDLQTNASRANSIPGGAVAFDATSRLARPTVRSITNVLSEARQSVDRVGNSLTKWNAPIRAFMTMDQSLSDFEKKLAPAEKTAAKLQKTLGKKLSIKIPFSKKTVTFSIRDILEKPGKVLGVVLKPLEKLADKVLQPVLKELKLEIKAPSGIANLNSELNRLPAIEASLRREADQLQQQITTRLQQIIQSWSRIQPHLPRHLTSQPQPPKRPIARERPAQNPPSSKPAPVREFPAMFIQP
jgi:chromosome segregation ATPase